VTNQVTYETDVAWERLSPHPDNPRRGDVDSIEASIRQNGWYGTVVAQTSTGYVLIGNHRSLAARNVGLPACPAVQWVDCDDEQARRILLSDNRTADLAVYDDELLTELLDTLADTDLGLAGTGFDTETVVLPDFGDEVPPPVEPPVPTPVWDGTELRTVVLPFTTSDYDRLNTMFAELRERWSLDSNAQVVLQLALDATTG
jgi:hypothetical protein